MERTVRVVLRGVENVGRGKTERGKLLLDVLAVAFTNSWMGVKRGEQCFHLNVMGGLKKTPKKSFSKCHGRSGGENVEIPAGPSTVGSLMNKHERK